MITIAKLTTLMIIKHLHYNISSNKNINNNSSTYYYPIPCLGSPVHILV